MANRGYSSSTAMYDASKRLYWADREGKRPVIIYLGDHDPSGMDMARDIRDRLDLMAGWAGIEVQRLALNYDQVEKHQPPPNPAKTTDSRSTAYIVEFGDESWELDALDPTVLDNLVSEAIGSLIDWDLYEAKYEEETERGVGLRALPR